MPGTALCILTTLQMRLPEFRSHSLGRIPSQWTSEPKLQKGPWEKVEILNVMGKLGGFSGAFLIP